MKHRVAPSNRSRELAIYHRQAKQPAFRLQRRVRWQKMAERRYLQGLTTRGTVPKRKLELRVLLAEIDALAAALAEEYQYMPPMSKARSMALCRQLSMLRKRLA